MYDDDVVRCTLTFTHFLAGFVPYLRPSLVNYSDLKLTECSKRGRTRVREYSTSVRSTCFFFLMKMYASVTCQRFNDSTIPTIPTFSSDFARRSLEEKNGGKNRLSSVETRCRFMKSQY